MTVRLPGRIEVRPPNITVFEYALRMEIYHSQVQLSVEYLNALYIETIHIYVVSIRRSNVRKKAKRIDINSN